jgi:phospholipid:diacylglycerol acyltransferase
MTTRMGMFIYLFSPQQRRIKSIIMSSLRRRILGPLGDSIPESTEASRDPSPAKGEAVTLIPAAQLKKLKSKKSKSRSGLIFGLGGLFGLVVAAYFANQHDVINLEGLVDFNLDSLMDVIPAGIVKDAKDITVHTPNVRGWEGAQQLKMLMQMVSIAT